MDLKYLFEPKSIAVIGASRDPQKIGHVILKNFLEGGYGGTVYPVNPSAEVILFQHSYESIKDVPGSVECAIIATPAATVVPLLRQCVDKGVKAVIIITSGFAEVGNVKDEEEIKKIAKESGMAVLGPNVMGLINTSKRIDSVFNPLYKLGRPRSGEIAMISQSGAVGAAIIDLAAKIGLGMSKFVSYGNAAVITETDLLKYLRDDPKTKIIAMYTESIRDGRKFFEVAREITKTKPIIAIKAGKTSAGQKAAASHTASLAGDYAVYSAAFKQAGIIEVESLTDLFDYSKAFLQPFPKGDRVAVVTNAGGIGVISSDWIELNHMKMAEFDDETKLALREQLPGHVNIGNPLDLAGDADSKRFEFALNHVLDDPNVDSVIVVPLMQTVNLGPGVINVIIDASAKRLKPILAISIGGKYTENNRMVLENGGVPVYSSPYVAIRALAKLTWYSKIHQYGKE